MWKLTDVADAKPAIIFVVARTCFKSKYALELAASEDAACNTTPSSVMVNVCADAEVFVTTIFEITAVVDDGTVYSVVDEVAAAVLARALVNVAMYFLPFLLVVSPFYCGSLIVLLYTILIS
jgi:hypothetical protein